MNETEETPAAETTPPRITIRGVEPPRSYKFEECDVICNTDGGGWDFILRDRRSGAALQVDQEDDEKNSFVLCQTPEGGELVPLFSITNGQMLDLVKEVNRNLGVRLVEEAEMYRRLYEEVKLREGAPASPLAQRLQRVGVEATADEAPPPPIQPGRQRGFRVTPAR